MGAGVNRHEVALPVEPVDLAKLAGFSIVLCRYLGPRQQLKIQQAIEARRSETRKTVGEDWAGRMVSAVTPEVREGAGARGSRSSRSMTRSSGRAGQWPDDLVCRTAIKARDGADVTPESIDEWLDDGPHPDVVKHIAVGVLRASKLIPETEAARGMTPAARQKSRRPRRRAAARRSHSVRRPPVQPVDPGGC